MSTNRWTILLVSAALAGVAWSAAPAAGQNDKNNRQAEAALQAAINKEVVDGDLEAAIEQYKDLTSKYSGDRAVVADALLRMAEAYQKLGDTESRKIFEQVVRDFADQKQAADQARVLLEALQVSPAGKLNPRLIWSSAGRQLGSAEPSPDDRYFSFVDDTGDAAIRDLRTGASRRLTNLDGRWGRAVNPKDESGYADELLPSPDSKQLAYTLYLDKENSHKVELRVASVSEPVRTTVILRTDVGSDYFSPRAWTPDGKQLIAVRKTADRNNQLGIVTLQDKSFRSIKSLDWRYPNVVSLSPDGRYIAYDAPANDVGSLLDIFVLAVDGSREATVVRNPANDGYPLWSPDGSRLIFLSDRTGSNAIWTVPVKDGRASGPAELIKPDAGSIQLQAITKSGMLYYFQPPYNPSNLYVTDLNSLLPAKTALPFTERLISSNTGAAWSRDGEYLAYYSERPIFAGRLTGVLVIRAATTGEERTVPLPTRTAYRWGAGPKWFPDNRSVLIESGDAQGPGFGFYRLTLDTGNTEVLAHVPGQVDSYDISPDGRTIYYAYYKETGFELIRFDIDSRRETELANPGDGEIESIALSPDGKEVAMILSGGAIEIVPSDGGQPREVFRPAEVDIAPARQALAWAPDQRYLLFVRGDGGLNAVPAAGGEARQLNVSMGFAPSLAVRPDGKQLVFSAPSGKPAVGKLWALESFLPAGNTKTR